MPSSDLKHHWNKAYDRTETNKLGWFEETCEPSMELITKCNLKKNSTLLNVGAGATYLIDELIELGFDNLIANDISESALEKIKNRLKDKVENIKFVVDDLTNSTILKNHKQVDLWHDRAVLHFFNKKEDQDAYFDLLNKIVKSKGYAIIATFNLNGALKCSGLPVYRYDEKMIIERIGKRFELIESFNHTFYNPAGDTREYVYTLFRKK